MLKLAFPLSPNHKENIVLEDMDSIKRFYHLNIDPTEDGPAIITNEKDNFIATIDHNGYFHYVH